MYSALKLVVPGELRQLNRKDKSAELFIDKVGALKTGFEESCDLLTDEYFKGAFGYEQGR